MAIDGTAMSVNRDWRLMSKTVEILEALKSKLEEDAYVGGQGLQALNQAIEARTEELRKVLSTAHKVFGSESDKLQARLKLIEDKAKEQYDEKWKYLKECERLDARLSAMEKRVGVEEILEIIDSKFPKEKQSITRNLAQAISKSIRG